MTNKVRSLAEHPRYRKPRLLLADRPTCKILPHPVLYELEEWLKRYGTKEQRKNFRNWKRILQLEGRRGYARNGRT